MSALCIFCISLSYKEKCIKTPCKEHLEHLGVPSYCDSLRNALQQMGCPSVSRNNRNSYYKLIGAGCQPERIRTLSLCRQAVSISAFSVMVLLSLSVLMW